MRKFFEEIALGLNFTWVKKEEDFSRCYHDRSISSIERTSETKAWWQRIEQIQVIQVDQARL